eukprot:gene10674-14335_t
MFGSSAAVLIGDSAHSFPPDLGQGVNSALEDVVYLDRAFKNSSFIHLKDYLTDFQNHRLPEIKALIKLMIFGYPYQYDQYPLRNELWKIGAAIRLLLNKLFPFVIDPPAFLMIQNHNLKYQTVM